MSIETNEEFRPKIVAFCCNWCSYAGADLAGSSRLSYPADVKIIRVPCSCRVNPMFILRAFEKGADGVIMCGCHPGDCHYTTGNYYARRRMTLLFSMLDFIGVENGRTRVEWVSAAEGVKFSQTMNEFVEKIHSLGKNVRLEDLRCSEQAKNIVHIPKILCHSMKAENLITEEQEKKNWEAGRKALEEHYRRAEVSATAELADKKGWYRSHLTISGEPMISVIIPSKDHINDLELCISSIEEKTTWKNYEIIIVENNSVEKETFVYYETLKNRYPNVRILTWKKEFNYSAINNFAVREAQGEYLLFLNNDVEIITENWLEEMLQLCQQKDVGMVGAKLYYPDDTIQHAGVVVGLGGVAAHVLCKLPRDAEGYMGRLRCVQEISAVTAACMMVKTSVFKAVGGFDEELKVAFNDIDLCMKVRKYGVKIIFTPYAELYHYESKSRGMEDTPEKQLRFSREVNCFRRKWERELLKGDPYYNPNLTLNNTDCSLRKQEKNGD